MKDEKEEEEKEEKEEVEYCLKPAQKFALLVQSLRRTREFQFVKFI